MPADGPANPWDFSHLPGLQAVIDPRDATGARNELIDRIHRRGIEEAVRRAGGGPFGTALDFGCGVGRLAPVLLRLADRVIGVDPAEGMLRQARERVTDPRAAFVLPARVPALEPPTLVTATYVLAILPHDEVLAALLDLRARVDDQGRLVLVERVVRAPGCEPADIEPRDAGWYRDVLRRSGWEPMGARRIRRQASIPVLANARITPLMPVAARSSTVAMWAAVERARAPRARRGLYVDLAMWARPARDAHLARRRRDHRARATTR